MQQPPDILQAYPLSTPQQAAALARGDVAVTAGAGTGKTRTLVARYLALLAADRPLRQIVAITFTRKAAREMRNRVRREIAAYLAQPGLAAAERQRWQANFNGLDAARIGTIHNLCAEILRAHPAEAGIDPRFAVLDETQTALLLREAAEAALTWAVADAPVPPLLNLLRERPLQELITLLLQKRLAVQDVVDQLPAESIHAHWQAQLDARQAEQLAQLLADPAFAAARRCLENNPAAVPDDKCEVQRRLALAALDLPPAAPLADRLRQLAGLAAINLVGGSQKSWPGGKAQLAEVKEALRCLREAFRAQTLLGLRLNDRDTAVAAAMPAIYRLFRHAAQVYARLKAERDALDFDDLEALAIRLLETFPAAAGYWQGQIAALLVDEFQDTNARQARLIRLLCPEAGKLFIVGDAKQSIYRFRGADVTVFAAEKAQIGGAQGALIDLDTSYRAHARLLSDMNALLAPVLGADTPDRPPWVAPFAPLAPGDKAAAADLAAPFVEFHLAIGKKDDALPTAAAALAARLARLRQEAGFDYDDMAILCRTSGAFRYYEDALDAAGVPYLTVAGKGFYDRPEIRDLLNALRAIADPHDDLALVGLLRSPAVGLSDGALYRLLAARQAAADGRSLWQRLLAGEAPVEADEAARLKTAVALIADLHQQAGRIPVADVCKQFLDRTHYRAILRRAGQPRALRNVAKLLTDIHGSELVGIGEFLEYAQALRDSGSREGEARGTGAGAVQIMSIHAAKGLEFPVVALGDAGSDSHRGAEVLIDAGLGILLAAKDDDGLRAAGYELGAALNKAQEQAERDRLLYVALTRAEQLLLISGGIQQTKQGFSWPGWLGQLADVTGLRGVDLSAYDDGGNGRHVFDVGGAAAARGIVYEPGAVGAAAAVAAAPAEGAAEAAPARPPLQPPLVAAPAAGAADDDETPQRVWQVVPTAQRPLAPAWLVGTLVHAALALWRFPGAGFDAWVTARAREYGLTDTQQLKHARTATARLLARLRQHPRFGDMARAERRLHEVPYSYVRSGQVETGYVDLLYRVDGAWRLVDFKTDRVADEAALRRILTQTDYRAQVQGYGTAVRRLLGVEARLELCWLDYGGEVRFTALFPPLSPLPKGGEIGSPPPLGED